MKRWRGVVVGAGYFSEFHLDAWSRLDRCEIVCVCDQQPDQARLAAEKFGIANWSDDPLVWLSRNDIDFVDIVTPPDSHLQLVADAVQQQLAIICQKPLAPDHETARQIASIVKSSERPFMVHENFRWQPWYREVKSLLESGVVGSVIHHVAMRTRLGDGWGERAYMDRQPYFRSMDRFLVHETGVHFVDTFRFLVGEIRSVTAQLKRLNSDILGEDAGMIVLQFENGASGLWDANRYNESLAKNPRFTFGQFCLEANGGSIWVDDQGQITIKQLGESEMPHPYPIPQNGFAGDCVFATQRHFLDVLDGIAECETDIEDYMRTLIAVESIYESAKQRKTIDVTHSPRAMKLSTQTQDSLPPVTSGPQGRFVDLSLPIDERLPKALVEPCKTIDEHGWNATTLTLYSHCGTHMDAPRHFLPEGRTLDQQALSTCCGPARLVDLIPVQPRELITVERFTAQSGEVQPGERILIRTGWHKRFPLPEYRDELPRISLELAEWLVDQQVALIGVEPPSVADVNNRQELTDVHQTLFRGNVLIVEGLANLDQIQSEHFEFIALPLRIMNGDGCPVRAIAIEHEGRVE